MKTASDLVKGMPPYLFSALERKKAELVQKGIDVIDLGIGAPDLPPPPFVIDALKRELDDPRNYTYSPYAGCREYREAVAAFYKQQYGVELDPDTEVLALIGSKEGIVHLLQALIDPGDAVLIPNPGYPVYRTAVHLARGTPLELPLDAAHDYAPQFSAVDPSTYDRINIMLLNYPSNPTASMATVDVFAEAVALANKHQFLIAHDSAYSLLTFGDARAPSVLQVDGAKDVAVEFGSLSKSYNMAGCRIGYIVGNRDVIRALAVLKGNIDTCQFLAVQKAAAAALRGGIEAAKENSRIYEERMKAMTAALWKMGVPVRPPQATFFLWVPTAVGCSAAEFAARLLDEAGVIVTPGTAFGSGGEGYVRVSLAAPLERLLEAAQRWAAIDWEGRS
ncbi:aminotransferase class I/II-fold pyridoxal phosphate-dependent enzyme [Geobacillus sp. BK01]|uniref:aminotransferase class I/II-fold pyridoxal phosphate-dependent enzyme n=1 Tax=Geobacillus sp. BK01 TaxID=3457328 RepID=UPI003FA5F6FC